MSPSGPACRAPSVSLYLDPLGVVRPCCVNPFYVLGRIGESTLAEIWHGQQTEELRARLEVGDMSGGCDACRPAPGSDDADGSFARTFDDLPLEGAPPDTAWPAQLELALSNTCNLQCTMCTGTLSSAIRAGREGLDPLPTVYDDDFFRQLTPFLAHVQRISFLGGEPLLARETWRVVALLAEVGNRPRLQVTTNGTIWGPRVERLLDDHPTDVVVSVDAVDPDLMRSIRVGIDPDRVLRNLPRFRDRARAQGGSLAIAHCLMVESWPDLRAVLALADDLDVDVFLNDVTWPAASAYWALEGHERERILAALRRQEADGPVLGRNAGVWDEALQRIAALPDAVAVSIPDPVRRIGPPVVLVVDGQHQLVRVDPDPGDVFGVDLTPVLGRPVGEWREPFHAVHGPLRRSQVQRGEGGGEVWTLEVGSDDDARLLRAEYRPEVLGGGTWELTLGEAQMS